VFKLKKSTGATISNKRRLLFPSPALPGSGSKGLISARHLGHPCKNCGKVNGIGMNCANFLEKKAFLHEKSRA